MVRRDTYALQVMLIPFTKRISMDSSFSSSYKIFVSAGGLLGLHRVLVYYQNRPLLVALLWNWTMLRGAGNEVVEEDPRATKAPWHAPEWSPRSYLQNLSSNFIHERA